MRRIRWDVFRAAFVPLGLFIAGCQTTGVSWLAPLAAHKQVGSPPHASSAVRPSATHAQVTHIQPAAEGSPGPEPVPLPAPHDDLPAGVPVLDGSQLVAAVLARNPSLEAAAAAWQAAAQRYPQEVSLEDPMFSFMLGPGTWGNDTFDSAYKLEASQKIPWPGKRLLRGQKAGAEAQAAQSEVYDVELRLAEAARLAFFDYYLVHRQLVLNDENSQVSRELREAADANYRVNKAPQHDVLQADVELANLQRRRFELVRSERLAVARINTLLHRLPKAPLPPPPPALEPPTDLPPVEPLWQRALQQRPDLAALAAQIDAERAALSLAYREFYPDVEFMAQYDAFWVEDPLRTGVGLNVNVPLYRRRRWAAVCEATQRLRQRQADLASRQDQAQEEVQSAYERIVESRRTIDLYGTRLVPDAQQNLEAARAGYVAAKEDFLRVVDAQRQLIMLREQQVEAEAEYHRRLAELERVLGGPFSQ